MSEHRQPVEVWIRRLPEKEGKKSPDSCTLKIELFPARYWALKWEPCSSLFSPKPSLNSLTRKEYWLSRYRVRVNGKWLGGRAKYVTYTKEQVLELYFR
jgi:hypothetical protein